MGVKIAKLLADFQAGDPVAKFDKEGQAGGSRKYGYASYNSVIECLKQLAAKGLSWRHEVGGGLGEDHSNLLIVTTYLSYEDEEISAEMIRPMMPDIQKLGSEITYIKRYQLVALCGMAADEDDDGAAAMPETTAKTSKTAAPAKQLATAQSPTAAQLASAMTYLSKCDTARARQEFMANVSAKVKQKKLTSADYSTLAMKVIGMCHDPDELSTNVETLIDIALEDKVVDDKAASLIRTAIHQRVGQLNSAAQIGGRLKSGT